MTARPRRTTASEATAQRLSILLRGLRVLESEGVATTSSRLLAERFGLHPAQIRKDLNTFGDFGVRGVGYQVPVLRERLAALLGLDRTRTVVVTGAGNLGMALADSRNFNEPPFRVAALFDVDPGKVGSRSRTGVQVLAASEIPAAVPRLGAEIGVLAVPAAAAPAAAQALVSAGIGALLNFAPAAVGPFPRVAVKNADLTLFLEGLSFLLAGAA